MLTAATCHADFPSLEGKVYLNTAAEGIPPRPVIAALAQYAQDKLLGMDGRKLHEAQWRDLKEWTARFYGLSAGEIGLCSCTSEAYNLAALALQLRPGDEVVINDLEYPAGSSPFLQGVCPATVKVWRSRDGALRVEDLAPLLSPRTRLVPLSLVSFYNGFMLPLPAVIETVRRHSPALISVDVTQALGRVPLDLRGVDLIVSSTHKWILASHGGGLVGVPTARAAELTSPAGGWFHLQDPFSSERFERPAMSQMGAASFSVGMPNYPAVYAAAAALCYLSAVGVEKIHAHAQPLVQQCLLGLQQLPVELLTPAEPQHLAGILAFRHPEAQQLFDALHGRNIHVMCHAGRLRVAIHGYNTAADIDQFLSALREALHV